MRMIICRLRLSRCLPYHYVIYFGARPFDEDSGIVLSVSLFEIELHFDDFHIIF